MSFPQNFKNPWKSRKFLGILAIMHPGDQSESNLQELGHHCNENPESAENCQKSMKILGHHAEFSWEAYRIPWKSKFLGNLSIMQWDSWTLPGNDPDKGRWYRPSGSANSWILKEVYKTSRDHTTSWEGSATYPKLWSPNWYIWIFWPNFDMQIT